MTSPYSEMLDEPEERAALRSILAQADTVVTIDADLPRGVTFSESMMPALLFLDLLDRYEALLAARASDATLRALERLMGEALGNWKPMDDRYERFYGLLVEAGAALRAALASPEESR